SGEAPAPQGSGAQGSQDPRGQAAPGEEPEPRRRPGRPRTRRPAAHRPGAGDRSRGGSVVFRPPPPLPESAPGLDRRAAPHRWGLPRDVPPARRPAPACEDQDQDEVTAPPARAGPGRDPQRITRAPPLEELTVKYSLICAHLEPTDRIECQT